MAEQEKTAEKPGESKEQANAEQQERRLAQALKTLQTWLTELAAGAGETEQYALDLWERMRQSTGVLREFAYYHDYGKFLCEYQVAGYTLADILVWQVDHFKAYLDRPEEMNRYRQERLLLTALDIMLQMEQNPQPYAEKMRGETGTDFQGKY